MKNKELFITTVTVIRDIGDSYIIRITQIDENTGDKNEYNEIIKHELFETGIKCGYLSKMIV